MNEGGEVKYSATFETMGLADAWIASCERSKCWGKSDSWRLQDTLNPFPTDGLEARHQENCSITLENDCKEYFIKGDYEIIKRDITDEMQAIKDRESKIAKGRAVRKLSEDILDVIAGFNIDSDLSITEIDQMTSTFAKPKAYLEANRPFSAKPLLEAIVPDGRIVTESMRKMILDLYSEFKF